MARPASDIRDRLLESALQHFADRGVDAASMRRIAQDAGTSVGMIAYHFDAKDGLFFALVESFYSRLVADLEAIVAATPHPVERLRAVLQRLAALNADEQRAARMVIRELSVSSERVRALVPMVFDGHVRILVDALRQGMDEGLFRELPLFQTIPTLLAPIIVPQLVPIPAVLGVDRAGMVDATIAVLLEGLLPRPG